MPFADKGTVFFDSPYVLMTTNDCGKGGFKKWKLQAGIKEPAAVYRRCHIVIDVQEQLTGPVMDHKFTIVQCLPCKTLTDKVVTGRELMGLIPRLKEAHTSQTTAHNITDDDLATVPKIDLATFNPQDDSYSSKYGINIPSCTPEAFIELLVKTGLMSFSDNFKKFYLPLFFGIVSLCCFGTMYYLFSRHFSKEEDEEEMVYTESHRDNVGTGHRTNAKRVKSHQLDKAIRKQFGGVTVLTTQSQESNYLESLNGHASNCLMHIQAVEVGSYDLVPLESCVGFHIKDHLVGVPAHFMLQFIGTKNVKFRVKTGRKTVLIPMPETLTKLGKTDFVAFKLPMNFDKPVEIYGSTVSINDMPAIGPGESLQLLIRKSNGTHCRKDLTYSVVNHPISYSKSGIDATFTVDHPVGYNGTTVAGDCGGLLFASSKNGLPIVVGMHVGISRHTSEEGSKVTGISIPIYREMFDDMLSSFEVQSDPLPFPLVVKETLPSTTGSSLFRASKLRRTRLYGWHDPPLKVPAKLRPYQTPDGTSVNPMYRALSKLHQEPTKPTDIPNSSMEYCKNLYPRHESARVLTLDEVLNGDGSNINSINTGTSAGWPLSAGGVKGKELYLPRDPATGKLTISPIFQPTYDYNDKLLNDGLPIETIWADALKDETRLKSKVLEGKTRVVSSCSLHYLLLFRKYFGAFCGYVQSLCGDHPISVGINVHSTQWTDLYTRLNKTADSVIAGDFSNYDGKLPKFVGEKVLELVNWWYNDGPQNSRARSLLMDHIFNATRMCGNVVYQVVDGNPSGNPFTSIYNSLCNIIMTYTILSEDLKLSSDQFEMAVYGDDNLMTVQGERKYKYSDLSPHYKRRFDMDYTHSSKLETDVEDTLFSVSYIGRKFSPHLGVMRAPLPHSTIVESTYWRKQGAPENVVVTSTAMSHFIELSHHPPEFFQIHADAYLAAVKSSYPEMYPTICRLRQPYDEYYNNMYVHNRVHMDYSQDASWYK